jgi:hypothetical protein
VPRRLVEGIRGLGAARDDTTPRAAVGVE